MNGFDKRPGEHPRTYLPAVHRTAGPLAKRNAAAGWRNRGHIVLRPFVTMVDWLSVMMMGPWHTLTGKSGDVFKWDVPNVRPGLSVHRLDGVPNLWNTRFYVSDAVGEKLATVCCSPVDPKKFPPDFMTVQFANSTLATGEWRELMRGFREMGCEHMGVQRVDIAADGWEDQGIGGGGDYIPVVQAALCGFGDYYGRAHWKTHHLGRAFNGFEFGSKAGNKFLRCYRKKREMKAKGIKPHVIAAWRAALNGADPMADPREVGRLEIQLKGKELRRYFAGESDADLLAQLHDPHTRVQVFASTTRTVFDFRTHPTDGRARTARPMHVWDWSQCTTNAPANLSREQRVRRLSAQRVKSGLHVLYDIYLECRDPDILKAAERYALSAGQEFLDHMRRRALEWEKLHDALTIGTAKRPGATDVFTLSFMERLRRGVMEGEQDRLADFLDQGLPGVSDAVIDDGTDCDGFVF